MKKQTQPLLSSLQLRRLQSEAKKARTRSHSPYSRRRVGAAILTQNGKIYSGCNIENSSYGGTVCAERVAVFKAVSEGHQKIQAVYVYTDASPPWPPCGLCRQVIQEFATEKTWVIYGGPRGAAQVRALGELLPEAFSARNLRK